MSSNAYPAWETLGATGGKTHPIMGVNVSIFSRKGILQENFALKIIHWDKPKSLFAISRIKTKEISKLNNAYQGKQLIKVLALLESY